MRRLLPALLLGAAALATPALALTVSPSPDRQAVSHLKAEKGSAAGTDLRDTLAADGRPLEGGSYRSSGTYGQTQTFGFGSVTTTVTTGRTDYRSTFTDDYRPSYSERLRTPDLLPRRR